MSDYQFPVIIEKSRIPLQIDNQQQYQDSYRTYFRTSTDIYTDQWLEAYLILIEELLKRIHNSEALPFTIDKSFKGFEVIRTNKLGELFYKLIQVQNGGRQPPYAFRPLDSNSCLQHYKTSEAEKLIATIGYDLQLNLVNITGDPKSVLCPSNFYTYQKTGNQSSFASIGNLSIKKFTPPLLANTDTEQMPLTPNLASGIHMLEGELINTFVVRIREIMNSTTFIDNAQKRKEESKTKADQSAKFVKKLYSITPNLLTTRVLLFYNTKIAQPTLKESDDHFRTFLRDLGYSGSFKKNTGLLGWWWKRGYMTETSFYYHLILFFPHATNQNDVINDCWRRWKEFTGNKGVGHIPFVDEWGIPFYFNREHQAEIAQVQCFDNQLTTVGSIKRMLKCENAWRLKDKLEENSESFEHYGMSSIS